MINYMPPLINALTDEVSDVRKEAAIALGKLANPAALQALQQALDDPDREVSIRAERAIANIQQTLVEKS